MRSITLGAIPLSDGRCRFRVWPPQADILEVRLVSSVERLLPLTRGRDGYFYGIGDHVGPGGLIATILQAEAHFDLTLPAQLLTLLARTPEES
jgi:hypothetical protein